MKQIPPGILRFHCTIDEPLINLVTRFVADQGQLFKRTKLLINKQYTLVFYLELDPRDLEGLDFSLAEGLFIPIKNQLEKEYGAKNVYFEIFEMSTYGHMAQLQDQFEELQKTNEIKFNEARQKNESLKNIVEVLRQEIEKLKRDRSVEK